MQNQPSYKAFLQNLIDYAGLFPPANLDLKTAVHNYAEYIHSEDSWMLGPFVIPLNKMNEIINYASLFNKKKPLILSIVGRKSENEQECIRLMQEDFRAIQQMIIGNDSWYQIKVYEIPLPEQVPSQILLKELAHGAERAGVKVFCEVPLIKENHWREHLMRTLDTVAAFNAAHANSLGIKLRTGGIKAEMIPSAEKVTAVLAECRDRKLPLKFTAGLHHPIRMYRDEVKDKMHGFINIFLAGMLAHDQCLDEKEIENIILDEEKKHFKLESDHFSWKNLSLSAMTIEKLRKHSLCSFGCCSFDEPRNELLELGREQEVIK